MRKRNIIAIVITIIMVFATNKLWINVKPLSVDFDIYAKGEHNFVIQLNKEDNDDFIKTKAAQGGGVSTSNHLKFDIIRAKNPKRIRIKIICEDNLSPIIIKNIQLNNKIELNNLKEMKVAGANVIKNDKELVLNPITSEIILTYPKTLNIKCKTEYNLCFLIIIIILTYLFVYKLLNYTAEFNTIYKKPKTEVIFLSVFFIFLFIPMSHIDKRIISKHENRVLAKAPVLITEDKQINYNYTKQFDNWFNDRFNLRNIFIEAYNIKLILNKNWKTKDVIKGKDNWLFLGWMESINSYGNRNLFNSEQLEDFANYFIKIDNYCKSHNKHFYLLIAPDKARIYPECYPDDIKPAGSESLTQQVVEYLNKNTNVKVIYPKDELTSKKGDELLYFKQDTHWTPLGAYIGYLELMKEIKKDYKDINVYKAKYYKNIDYSGDLYNMTSKILRKKDTTLYKVPDINNDLLCKNNIKNSEKLITCFNDKNSDINLVSYRDSFSSALIPYYCESFRNAKYIWKYDIDKDTLKDADIVIFEVVERYIPAVLKIIEENKNAI